MSRIVITGGPGTGKTTLLLALQARGYTIVGDSARAIIHDRRKRGLSPRPNAYEFAHEILRRDIENFVHPAATPGHVFFDRSVLDALCGTESSKIRFRGRLWFPYRQGRLVIQEVAIPR